MQVGAENERMVDSCTKASKEHLVKASLEAGDPRALNPPPPTTNITNNSSTRSQPGKSRLLTLQTPKLHHPSNRSPQKLHTQLREAYPSTATRAGNPASRSDAGFGGLKHHLSAYGIATVYNTPSLPAVSAATVPPPHPDRLQDSS